MAQWTSNLGLVRDVVRQELVARQLAAHVPSPVPGSAVMRALDVGCGQGTQAIRLARLGYDVTGVDPDAALLTRARTDALLESGEVTARLRFVKGDLLALGEAHLRAYDVVCCHGVVMYLPSLRDAVRSAVSALRPGGTLSVLSRNRAGIAMRAGMLADGAGAVRGFDARTYDNRVGVDGVRADDPDEVADAVREAGAAVVAWYGVRLFTDHVPNAAPPADLETLLEAEAEAGRRDPYRQLCALTHTIAVRESG